MKPARTYPGIFTRRPALKTRLLATVTLLALCLHIPKISLAARPGDKHYNMAGFFDIHVCNWPGRPLFFMPLFSTAGYDDIRQIEIFYPDNSLLTRLDLSSYRTISKKDRPDKRVFIKQLDIPADAVDGWYAASITLTNGKVHRARDYVIISKLARAGGQVPGDEQELPAPPEKLSWQAVPGASFYQVFIRDQWDDNRLIHTSSLLAEPELALPDKLIEPGGLYSWTIHARDTNEDLMLGDFNHGSMNKPVSFSVRQ
jgi:hypothetical protein